VITRLCNNAHSSDGRGGQKVRRLIWPPHVTGARWQRQLPRRANERGIATARQLQLAGLALEPLWRFYVQFVTHGLRRVFVAIGVRRSARVLAGVLGLTILATVVASAPAAHAAPSLRYQRGYYVSGSWLCYGWSSGTYHCTRHWHRTANGRLVSDNPAWVPNYGGSAVTYRTWRNVHDPVARRIYRRPVTNDPPAYRGGNTGGSGVTGQISAVFGRYANQALNVARCESGFNPNAVNRSSGAAGVFQFLASTWRTTAYAGGSPFNASANIHAAYQVFARDGYSWREWTCRP
jgi:Transglycosylase-like domain